MRYVNYYRNELKAITGKFPDAGDAIPPDVFDRECPLPQLPAAMRAYYLAAGKHRLNTVFNPLYPPAELELRDGFLFFMDENQLVCRWALQETDLTQDDPEVFQMQENENGKVTAYSEKMPFSSFMAYALTYYAMQDEEPEDFDAWERRLNLYMECWKMHRVCVCCNQPVEDPDEFHPFGFVTMNPDDPDYPRNYRGAHRKCLTEFADANRL